MVTRKMRTVLLAVLVLLLSFSMIAAAPAKARNAVKLSTMLTGAAEVPGPGDPDGWGSARIKLDTTSGRVCWTLKVKDITLPASAAHIHVGGPDVAGPVVVPLSAPNERGKAQGCTMADPALVQAIADNPSGYYVNVHNVDYPAGALRGQLP